AAQPWLNTWTKRGILRECERLTIAASRPMPRPERIDARAVITIRPCSLSVRPIQPPSFLARTRYAGDRFSRPRPLRAAGRVSLQGDGTMIAFSHPPHGAARRPSQSMRNPPPAWQAGFLRLLPDICRQLRCAFRGLPPERREEAVQEALANALVAYRRLVERGKADLAYATPLASYAVKQVAGGRRVARPLNMYDTLSRYAQRKLGFAVVRLHQADAAENTWKEVLVADRRATPAELAASRLDFAAWWRRLPRRKRRIAAALAGGATTSETARVFKLTAGRISQLRRELERNWRQFHGEGARAAVGGE
ncbi:MAG TPA: hypothetical protein VFU81_12165, partial [Thermomicrobiales bacterium]|nr:hypothetical protein [Thermomicrobiales bacterium]